MTGLNLFLFLIAAGTGIIALWVVADVAKKLTRQTRSMITETQEDMVRMLEQSNKASHEMEEQLIELRRAVIRMKQSHKREIAKLSALVAEKKDAQIVRLNRSANF